MGFIEQFMSVINDKEVERRSRDLLRYGAAGNNFMNYFGVNYLGNSIVSVKLYFSFFDMPSYEAFNAFSLPSHGYEVIRKYWRPSDSYSFLHQGLTFSMKCYFSEGSIKINNYVGFRSPMLPWVDPRGAILSEEDKENYPGICLESHDGFCEIKNYYYITSDPSKRIVLEDFNVPSSEMDKIFLIEYAESDGMSKVNLLYRDPKDVQDLLVLDGNPAERELSQHLADAYDVCVCAPGRRKGSDTRAIYYVTEEGARHLCAYQTVRNLYK